MQALELLRSFKGLNLVGCDLVEVSPPYDTAGNTALVAANLEMGRFFRADMSGADLSAVNLETARMNFTWLVGAKLVGADLQETKFVGSNLQDADLGGAVLRFAIFPDAHLQGCRGCPEGW